MNGTRYSDKTEFSFPKSRVNSASKAIVAAISMSQFPKPQVGRGIQSSSSLARVARALDQLIFDEELVSAGACLHQGPVRKRDDRGGTPECADILITKFLSNGYPSTPVLVSDLKLYDYEKCERETTCYSIVVAQGHNTTTFPVVIGLPATLASASIEIHVAIHEKMWRIPVIKASLSDKALLSTLCAAVRYMCSTNPIAHASALRYACPYKESNNYRPLVVGHRC